MRICSGRGLPDARERSVGAWRTALGCTRPLHRGRRGGPDSFPRWRAIARVATADKKLPGREDQATCQPGASVWSSCSPLVSLLFSSYSPLVPPLLCRSGSGTCLGAGRAADASRSQRIRRSRRRFCFKQKAGEGEIRRRTGGAVGAFPRWWARGGPGDRPVPTKVPRWWNDGHAGASGGPAVRR